MSQIFFFPPQFFLSDFLQTFPLFIMSSSIWLNHHILGHLMDFFPLTFNSNDVFNILVSILFT